MNAVTIAVFLGALIVFGIIAFVATSGGNSQLRKRASAIQGGTRGKAKPAIKKAAAGSTSLRRTEGRSVPLLEEMAKRYLPRQSELRDRLAQTGFNIAPGTYLAVNGALAVVAGGLLWLMAHLPALAAVFAGLAIGIGLPHMMVGFLAKRRRTKFMALLPDAMDLLVRGLKSGLPVTESIAAAGREMPAPLGPEFRRITDNVRIGRSLDEVMWETAKRLKTPEFNFFVISLSIQRETGGNLAETLANLSDILRKRKQIRLKIKALSSEARASAYILGALPFLMFGLIQMLNPKYAAVLYTDPRGQVMLGVAAVVLCMGFAIMAKMVRFEI
ncbi:MAG: type II secretion system F family protein [Defluviicoccus sp.]|nr:type II secretion system F family protein [Defluviicoccus sp.]MDG4593075.1 type II secretion system F family protein [Defluviicoccus sp.]MDS4072720.1 type II secretion system F family protein [Defluviicoccus sp.]